MTLLPNTLIFLVEKMREAFALIFISLDQQNRALEAATVTLRYFTALSPPTGKTREIFDLHFLAKPGFFQSHYCDVTKNRGAKLCAYLQHEK